MILNLKAFLFNRTTAEGRQEQCFVTCQNSYNDWDRKTVVIRFHNFASPEESQRKVKLLANAGQPTPIREQEPFAIVLEPAQFFAEAQKPAIGGRDFAADFQAIADGEMAYEEFLGIYGVSRLINQSDAIWETALNHQFIPDFSLIDEDGNRVEVLKSLTELNAVEIPVQVDVSEFLNS